MNLLMGNDKWVWHSTGEMPAIGAWIVCADRRGHYYCGQWEADGRGWRFTITLELFFGLKVTLPIDFKPYKWAYIQDRNKELFDNLKEVQL